MDLVIDQGRRPELGSIQFEKTFRLAYSRTRYGTGYYIYHQYMRGAKLSQPLRSWNTSTTPGKDVLQLISRAGTDLAPRGAEALSGKVTLKSGETAMIVRLVHQADATD